MTLSGCVVVKPIILVYGDSLTAESVAYIVFLMGDGYDVRVDAAGGTALCDYRDRMLRDAAALRPKLLISAFSGNSGTPCMEDRPTSMQVAEKYREDATFLAERLAGLKVPIAFVLPPPTLRQEESGAASVDVRVPLDSRYQTWAETGIDTESPDPVGPPTATSRTQSVRSWQVGEIPDGFRSQTHELDGVYRRIATDWRSRGAAVGIIDGFSPFATAQGSWTKVQPCGPGEAGTALCRNGLVDIRSEDLGHFCPTTASYQGLVPTCDTYSPGALRWASQMAAYVRFMDRETIGFLDRVTGGAETVTVEGWSIDPGLGLAPTQVHIYVDDAGTAVEANRSRPDVGRAFPVAGNDHGFSATIPAAPGFRSVCAYAINFSGAGSNVLLGCRTVQIVPASPFGFLDWAIGSANSISFAGWSADPDALGSSVQLQIQIGTQPTIMVTANSTRPDVAVAFPALGPRRGFIGSVATSPGRYSVCATAVNIGAGTNTVLGCRTVTVPSS